MFGWLFGKKKKDKEKEPEFETGRVHWYANPGTFDLREHHEHRSKKELSRTPQSASSSGDPDDWLSNVKKRSAEIKKKKKKR